jgi:hypothetical protein
LALAVSEYADVRRVVVVAVGIGFTGVGHQVIVAVGKRWVLADIRRLVTIAIVTKPRHLVVNIAPREEFSIVAVCGLCVVLHHGAGVRGENRRAKQSGDVDVY